jgi:hypothetical protein
MKHQLLVHDARSTGRVQTPGTAKVCRLLLEHGAQAEAWV